MNKKIFIVLLLATFSMVGCFSKGRVKSSPAPAPVTKPVKTTPQAMHYYYYYPNSYIYFDLESQNYFYWSGEKWISVKNLPNDIDLDDDYFINLEIASAEPYLDYEAHSAKYPRKLHDENEGHENMKEHDENRNENNKHD